MPAPPPRYSQRPFPAYAFVPGRNPHPTRDPDGHSFGEHPPALPPFEAHDWAGCGEYLYGIDLFNHGYWWEAHEALEAVWVAAGRRTPTGLFVQGLIQISVAHLKRHQGFDTVARRMAGAGLEKIGTGAPLRLGIDIAHLRDAVAGFCRGADAPLQIALQLPPAGGESR